jgi:hypothetical protein
MVTPAATEEHLDLLEFMEIILAVQCIVGSIAIHNWFLILIQSFSLRDSFKLSDARRREWSTTGMGLYEQRVEEQLFRFDDEIESKSVET